MKRHPDVEFGVSGTMIPVEKTFKTFDEAAYVAISTSANTGKPVNLDVMVYSESGAQWVGGTAGVEAYRDDPSASATLFQRFKIKVEAVTEGVVLQRR